MLEIRLLGQFDVRREGALVPLPSRPAQSLLAYLVLNPGTAHRREKLAGLLSPEATEANARRNLRQALWQIKKAIETEGRSYLAVDDLSIGFEATTDYWLDTSVLEQKAGEATSSADLTAAVSVYQGELLPGFYDEWVVLERERLQAVFEHKMDLLLERLAAEARWPEVLEWGERWIALGHTPEPAYRALMRAHSALGDSASAAASFRRGVEALRRELGVEPSAQTRALHARLSTGESQARLHEDGGSPAQRHNLPLQLTSFIGREREIEDVTQQLSGSRLVTLTGPGGSGKTRLAIQVAVAMVETFAAGVWLVELAGLADPALVPQAVASVLGVHEMPPQPLSESLVSYLREKHLLLILDNCEHLIQACADLAAGLLSTCPRLQILVTSREALGILGESALQVPTLSLPDPRQALPIQSLLQFEAIRLFAERAQAVKRAFALTASSAPAVSEVCYRLDGIPLAIELAAARVRLLSVEQIAARLDDRFNLLTSGSRTALPRHQTLRAMIDWSHDLLAEQERAVFRRLSVFAGGFTLAGATAVCSGEGVDESEALDLLSHLVDKSLVMVAVDPAGGEPRYRLLDTIQQYAGDKLREAGEAVRVQRRHAEYFLSLAEAAEPKFMTTDRGLWLSRLEAEHDNLRAALGWSEAEAGDSATMLRLAGALVWFWIHSGYLSEGRRGLTGALARDAVPSETPARAKALYGAGFILVRHGEMARAAALLAESVRLWRALGPVGKAGLAHALVIEGDVILKLGDPATARALGEESVALFRGQEDRWGLAYALAYLGMAIRDQEDFVLARSRVDESAALWRELGDLWGLGFALHRSGEVALRQGDYGTARSRWDEALATSKAIGDNQGVAWSLLNLGLVTLNQGDEARARPFFEESLSLFREMGNQYGIALNLVYFGRLALYDGDEALAQSYCTQALDLAREVGPKWLKGDCLKGWAGLAAVRGQARRAARLWGAAEAALVAAASYMDNADGIYYGRIVSAAQAQMGEAAFEAAHAEGMAMPVEEAVAYALGTEDTGGPGLSGDQETVVTT